METNPEKKYFVISRASILIALTIFYLLTELGIVASSIYQATQGNWTSGIWFLMAAATLRFYYTLQTKPPK
jgi:hypothetical protein